MPKVNININSKCKCGDCVIYGDDVCMIVQIAEDIYKLISISDANRYIETNVRNYSVSDIIRIFSDEDDIEKVVYMRSENYEINFVGEV